MSGEFELRRAQLTTPRSAAIAGVLFSVLLITALVLIRISAPADPRPVFPVWVLLIGADILIGNLRGK